jgi:hypothetical protein
MHAFAAKLSGMDIQCRIKYSPSLAMQIPGITIGLYDDSCRHQTPLINVFKTTIAAKPLSPKKVLKNTWNTYKDRYLTLKSDVGVSSERRRVFGEIIGVIGKKGPLLLKEIPEKETVFYGWPEGIPFQEITQEQVDEFIQNQKDTTIGIHENEPITRKQGKFGWYVVWNGKTTSCKEDDTLEMIIDKLKVLKEASLKQVGQFEIRKGPYGLYMFKTGVVGPSRKFVGLPATINLETVTEKELIVIFQEGLKQKARSSGYRGRGRGRGRGH